MFNRLVFLLVKRSMPVRRRSPYNIYLVFFPWRAWRFCWR